MVRAHSLTRFFFFFARHCVWSVTGRAGGGSALTGAFPAIDFKPLTSLAEMYWDGNGFTSLPASLGGASALTEISFDINNVRGAFPSGLCDLSELTDCRVGVDTDCSVYQACYPWVKQMNATGNVYSCPLPKSCGACDNSKSPLVCK